MLAPAKHAPKTRFQVLPHCLVLLAATTTLFIGATLLTGAKSASAGTVTIVPSHKEVRIGDEQSIDVPVYIDNSTNVDLVFDVEVMDYWADENGLITFRLDNRPQKYGLKEFVLLDQQQFAVSKHSREKVTATIINNSFLQPGGHYGAVVFAIKSENAGTIPVNQNIASLLLVSKHGGTPKLVTRQVVADSGIFSLPKNIELVIANEGNLHTAPVGTLKLTDPTGRVLYTAEINKSAGSILPETARKFVLGLSDINTFMPGKYGLHVVTGDTNYTAQIWHIPPTFLVVTTVAVAAGPLLFINRRKIGKLIKTKLNR